MNSIFRFKQNSVVSQIIAIFFIEISSSAAFAFFFSGLSLYLTQQKICSEHDATLITGLFLSLNYFLPFIGGLFANFLISTKKLYCLGALISLMGCYILARDINLYLGLSLFLMSSLVNNVCLNMFITHLFEAQQVKQRRVAFMWSYMGMNAGFLIGCFFSGYASNQNSFFNLFFLMGLLLAFSTLLTFYYIDEMNKHAKSTINQIISTSILLTLVVLFINILFNFAEFTEKYIGLLLILGISFYLYKVFKRTKKEERVNFIKFIGYSFLAIAFWALYMLTPVAFMQLIANDVQRDFAGINLAPQWFMNADSIIILIIAPVLAMLMSKAKSKINRSFHSINYFILAFFISVIALLVLLSGLHEVHNMKIPAWAMLGCLVFLAMAETFVGPISNSLIGELIPTSLHAMMTGYWSMTIGMGVLASTYISNFLLLPYINKDGLTTYNLVGLQQNVKIVCCAIIFLLLGIIIYNQIIKRFLTIGIRLQESGL